MSQEPVEVLNNTDLVESAVPDFLNTEYFEKIFPDRKIVNLKIQPTNDAFCSSMFKAELDLIDGSEIKHLNFYIKMQLEMKVAKNCLGKKNYNVHEKEMEMFENIFPEFKKILEVGGEGENVFPTAVFVDREREVLILADLSVTGFVLSDHPIGSDLEHTKWSLKKLARFHAASMVLLDSKPDAFKNFDVGMFSRKVLAFRDKFTTSMDALAAEVSSWSGYEYYAEKLENLRENMYEISCRTFDNESGDLKVLIHGDFWSRNMMYRYGDKGSVEDAIIVS